MTGQATAAHQLRFRVWAGFEPLRALQRAGVVTVQMALLAQEWDRCDQQRRLVRAVRAMAVEAIFTDRRMFEQKRAALFRMALIAGFVDRVGLEQGISQRAMRIMAIIAAHLSFRQRHVRAAVELQADVLVALSAGVADRHLGHAALDREFRHRIVAVAAGEAVTLMHGTQPVIAGTACMATQAGPRLYIDWRTPIFCVRNDEARREGIGRMLRTGAVAGFAHRNPRIGTIGDVQAEGVEGVREMIGFEPMARDAGLLADRSGVGSQRVVGDRRIGESGSGRRHVAVHRTICREVGRRE